MPPLTVALIAGRTTAPWRWRRIAARSWSSVGSGGAAGSVPRVARRASRSCSCAAAYVLCSVIAVRYGAGSASLSTGTPISALVVRYASFRRSCQGSRYAPVPWRTKASNRRTEQPSSSAYASVGVAYRAGPRGSHRWR